MTIILPLLLLVIYIAIVASLYTEGMWGNALMLINVVTAGLVATNLFEPLADWIENFNSTTKTFTYLIDFLALWAIFVLAMVILRLFSDRICRVKVRFLNLANQIGSVAFACLVALLFVCFATFTLHTAPLGKNFMYGAFKSSEGVVFGWAPDQWWLYFTRLISKGAYCRASANVFDPYGQFTKDYEDRRATLEKHVQSTGEIRVR